MCLDWRRPPLPGIVTGPSGTITTPSGSLTAFTTARSIATVGESV